MAPGSVEVGNKHCCMHQAHPASYAQCSVPLLSGKQTVSLQDFLYKSVFSLIQSSNSCQSCQLVLSAVLSAFGPKSIINRKHALYFFLR